MTDTPKKTPKGKDARLANLRPPWQPGECPNPDGRPRGSVSLRAMLKAKLAEALEGENGRSIADQLIDSTIDAALSGDAQARKLVFEYCEGKAPQTVGVDLISHEGPAINEAEYQALQSMSDEELWAEVDRLKKRVAG